MGRNRFVQPDIVRLQLTDGDWIDVKRRLNKGEQRAIMAANLGTVLPDGATKPNADVLGMAEVAEFLVDWSFVDGSGKVVPIDTMTKKLAALRALDPDDYDEIDAAIEAHKKAQETQRVAEKNGRSGESASSLISSSVGS